MTAVGIIVLVLIVVVGLLIAYGWITDRGVHPSPAVGAQDGASDDKG